MLAENYISSQIDVNPKSISGTVKLLDEGATIPFIARYRKEKTGGLDEVQISEIETLYTFFKELEKRRNFILQKIKEKGKLTAELEKQINGCFDADQLEDFYLPYKEKKSTKAETARKNGLEPLAQIIYAQREFDPYFKAKSFVKGDVKTADDAIEGALHIVAEWVSENTSMRNSVRDRFEKFGVVSCRVKRKKDTEPEAAVYKDYFKHDENLRHIQSHRFLAMMRGEKEGFLSVSIEPDAEKAINDIVFKCVPKRNNCGKLVAKAAEDAYKRLLQPQIESEYKKKLKEKADKESVLVFADNLKHLLLAPPLGNKSVLAIDPGIRTGCKWVCLDKFGTFLEKGTIFPDREPEKSSQIIQQKVKALNIEAIAVGNGTAGRETEQFIQNIDFGNAKPMIFLENEDGASIYSASETAREEFPNLDLVYRGAISIGRRLQDPLSELVKIDPKSLGVGQYQHDVNQTLLKEKLHEVVVSCVNKVGVNLNIASKHVLQFVSGLGQQTAENIIDFRKENGRFDTREQLKKVPRLGNKVFEQCAGFLRISDGKNVLDKSGIHPESYDLAKKMCHAVGAKPEDMFVNPQKLEGISLENFVTPEVGLPTLKHIVSEFKNPGLDPREPRKTFAFDPRIKSINDLVVGMKLAGIVTNVAAFGAFVDLGIKENGLIHISKMSHNRISSPNEVLKLRQEVYPRVVEVDIARKRISLSLVEG
ncbi:MAG: RNA-binding transcriptional accessory protein [Flavobacteriales bacterium]|nr:RNA-binding transcriptional accessory protein [Flavobacteriales bacterium]